MLRKPFPKDHSEDKASLPQIQEIRNSDIQIRKTLWPSLTAAKKAGAGLAVRARATPPALRHR